MGGGGAQMAPSPAQPQLGWRLQLCTLGPEALPSLGGGGVQTRRGKTGDLGLPSVVTSHQPGASVVTSHRPGTSVVTSHQLEGFLMLQVESRSWVSFRPCRSVTASVAGGGGTPRGCFPRRLVPSELGPDMALLCSVRNQGPRAPHTSNLHFPSHTHCWAGSRRRSPLCCWHPVPGPPR